MRILRISFCFFVGISLFACAHRSSARSPAAITPECLLANISPDLLQLKVLSPRALNEAVRSYKPLFDMVKSGTPITANVRTAMRPQLKIVFMNGTLFTVRQASERCAIQPCPPDVTFTFVTPIETTQPPNPFQQNEILSLAQFRMDVPGTGQLLIPIRNRSVGFLMQSQLATLSHLQEALKGIIEVSVR